MIKTSKTQALNLNEAYKNGADMSLRQDQILNNIVKKAGFIPEKIIWKSSYWGTNQIGAVHYLGTFKNQKSVLKIQGVKPEISEIYMIEQFRKQNRSKILRPPKLFATFSWEEDFGYEALIMEHITGKQVLESKKLQTKENIKNFLNYYLEYRKNCLPKKPWLSKPLKPDPKAELQKALETSFKAYPGHPLRLESDNKLLTEAVDILAKIGKNTELEFIHGHLSTYDLIYQGDEVVIFSNLFWKWKFPFYDAVVAYHWFIYELEHVEEITLIQVDEQRIIWQELLFSLPMVISSKKNEQLLKTALLERAISGLALDGFLMDPKKPITKYLFESTRGQIRKLIAELKD